MKQELMPSYFKPDAPLYNLDLTFEYDTLFGSVKDRDCKARELIKYLENVFSEPWHVTERLFLKSGAIKNLTKTAPLKAEVDGNLADFMDFAQVLRGDEKKSSYVHVHSQNGRVLMIHIDDNRVMYIR